jgi:DNA-nicking Smr family endonuclease
VVKPRPGGTRARKQAITPEERALFLEAVGGATPLGERDRLPVKPPPPSPAPRAAEVLPPEQKLSVEGDARRYAARAAGVSHAQVAGLRTAHVDATLDLHGSTVEVGLAELKKFFIESRRLGRRCVLVIHGRGLHSEAGAPLREAVIAELLGPLSGFTHALTSAAPAHGGEGATVVMLRGAK